MDRNFVTVILLDDVNNVQNFYSIKIYFYNIIFLLQSESETCHLYMWKWTPLERKSTLNWNIFCTLAHFKCLLILVLCFIKTFEESNFIQIVCHRNPLKKTKGSTFKNIDVE